MTKDIFILLLLSCFIPLFMIVVGYRFSRRPPKLGSSYGYRTRRSSINQDTWSFAHKYLGKTWFMLGLVTLFAAVADTLTYTDSGEGAVSSYTRFLLCIELLPFLGAFLMTEYNLNKTFFPNGKRKIVEEEPEETAPRKKKKKKK